MSANLEKSKQLREKTNLLWNWLTEQPEYISDSEKVNQKKLQEKDFKKKWGFYEDDPKSFYEFVGNRLANGRYQSAVWPLNFPWFLASWMKSKGKLRPKPQVLKVKIDYYQGDSIIIDQLKRILKTFRKVYEVKLDKSRIDFAALVFKAELLRRAGVKDKVIKQRLMEDFQLSKNISFEAKESYRKTLEKALARIK